VYKLDKGKLTRGPVGVVEVGSPRHLGMSGLNGKNGIRWGEAWILLLDIQGKRAWPRESRTRGVEAVEVLFEGRDTAAV
jgi:hypothetical protein